MTKIFLRSVINLMIVLSSQELIYVSFVNLFSLTQFPLSLRSHMHAPNHIHYTSLCSLTYRLSLAWNRISRIIHVRKRKSQELSANG